MLESKVSTLRCDSFLWETNVEIYVFLREKMSEYLPEGLAEMTLKMVGDRWKVLIIQNLLEGTKRFGELKRELGDITQKVLTSNLRLLEEKGIVIRKVYAQIPPRVDYTLTQLGYELKPVIDSMIKWAEEYRQSMADLLQIELKD